MSTWSLIALLAALVAGIFIGGLWNDLRNLRDRMKRMEENQAKHLPYKTADEIEDAIAALMRLEHELTFKRELLDNAFAHLKLARNGNEKK